MVYQVAPDEEKDIGFFRTQAAKLTTTVWTCCYIAHYHIECNAAAATEQRRTLDSLGDNRLSRAVSHGSVFLRWLDRLRAHRPSRTVSEIAVVSRDRQASSIYLDFSHNKGEKED